MSDDSGPTDSHNKLLLLRTRDLDSWELDSLVEMTGDCDPRVRDWATFAIAARDDDGENVRRLLLERATDSDFDTRSEAIWGLARRRDRRALPLLFEALHGERVGTLLIEAAGYLANREFIEPLKQLLVDWDEETELIEEVIARCRGKIRSRRSWEYVPANEPDC